MKINRATKAAIMDKTIATIAPALIPFVSLFLYLYELDENIISLVTFSSKFIRSTSLSIKETALCK